jgi:anti-sigma factor RsiW
MSDTTEDAHFEALMMKAVDGVITADERAELEKFLEENPERRAELADFSRIKEVTDHMTERMMIDVKIEPFRRSPAASAYTTAAFLLLLAGTLVALGFALNAFFFDAAVPLVLRIAILAAATGALALFLRVLWIRARASGRDPYEEIDR